ncbi:unnamed protein product [Symbiodinium natans]|uniref:Uncharacterized protein n=1 Tax=Symbiodinium natans TaxID=878477 RepID=A0A812UHG5_9DINO|nr:unnamed protein product [Symbiodinium natans]
MELARSAQGSNHGVLQFFGAAADGHGCLDLLARELGQAVMPGAQVELSLQLEVPKRGEGDGSDFARHVWVLADANNEPFGPLLVAEVVWLP